MDRASGSGVFARDPDAQLDMIELTVPETMKKQEENKAVCRACKIYLDAHWDWREDLSDDDLLNARSMLAYCENSLSDSQMAELNKQIEDEKRKVQQRTAWRLEATLREFRGFDPINVWFDYPIHCMDVSGALGDITLEEDKPRWQKGVEKNKDNVQKRKEDKKAALEEAIENGNFGEHPTLDDVAGYLGKSTRSIRTMVKDHGGYVVKDNKIMKKLGKEKH